MGPAFHRPHGDIPHSQVPRYESSIATCSLRADTFSALWSPTRTVGQSALHLIHRVLRHVQASRAEVTSCAGVASQPWFPLLLSMCVDWRSTADRRPAASRLLPAMPSR
jgi:hypothetical protein